MTSPGNVESLPGWVGRMLFISSASAAGLESHPSFSNVPGPEPSLAGSPWETIPMWIDAKAGALAAVLSR
jgi:hypothetical protein